MNTIGKSLRSSVNQSFGKFSEHSSPEQILEFIKNFPNNRRYNSGKSKTKAEEEADLIRKLVAENAASIMRAYRDMHGKRMHKNTLAGDLNKMLMDRHEIEREDSTFEANYLGCWPEIEKNAP
jgi:23S rRNA pseudoU1915 N3-methylase RlmH